MPKIAQIVTNVHFNNRENETKIILVGIYNNSEAEDAVASEAKEGFRVARNSKLSDAIHEKSKIALEQYKRGDLKQMYDEMYPDSPEDYELFLIYNCEFSLCVLDWDGTIIN